MPNSTSSPWPCKSEPDLFYSPEDDGRTEQGRVEREALAGMLCQGCPRRLNCLEDSLVWGEAYGVWGGLAEGERRIFREHLTEEGYGPREVPSGVELQASLNSFYRYMPTPDERFHPDRAEYVESDMAVA